MCVICTPSGPLIHFPPSESPVCSAFPRGWARASAIHSLSHSHSHSPTMFWIQITDLMRWLKVRKIRALCRFTLGSPIRGRTSSPSRRSAWPRRVTIQVRRSALSASGCCILNRVLFPRCNQEYPAGLFQFGNEQDGCDDEKSVHDIHVSKHRRENRGGACGGL